MVKTQGPFLCEEYFRKDGGRGSLRSEGPFYCKHPNSAHDTLVSGVTM